MTDALPSAGRVWRAPIVLVSSCVVVLVLIFNVLVRLDNTDGGQLRGYYWELSKLNIELQRFRRILVDPESAVDDIETGGDMLWSRANIFSAGDPAAYLRRYQIDEAFYRDIQWSVDALMADLREDGLINRRAWENAFAEHSQRLYRIFIDADQHNLLAFQAHAEKLDRLGTLNLVSFVLMTLGLLALLRVDRERRMSESHAREQLVKARQQLNDAIDNMVEGFALYDEQGRLVICNEAYRQTLTSGESVWRFSGDRSPGHAASHEWQHPDGRWIRSSERSFSDGWRVLIRSDFTTLRRQSDALERALSRAEAASAAKSNFLAVMSHEIRTPMNGVLGTLELLAGTELNDEQRRYTRIADTSAHQLLSLLDDILDLAQVESGKLVTQEHTFNLPTLVGDVIEVFDAQARKKGIELRADIADNVTTKMTGDSKRLRQVLVNLVSNAIKFTDEGGVTVTVAAQEPSRRFERAGVAFAVSDTGAGIPEDKLSEIFQPFTQLEDAYTRRHGGRGLGLAICSRLVALMGGALRVSSRENEGTCFFFALPLSPSSEDATDRVDNDPARVPAGLPVPTGKAPPVESHAGVSILLADDSEVNRLIARELLRRERFDVVEVDGGEKAVEQARQRRFDAILMDISMPDLSGIDATRQIRRDSLNHNTPIIAVTAHTSSEFFRECLSAGMDDLLSKPYRGEQLSRVLDRWVEPTIENLRTG